MFSPLALLLSSFAALAGTLTVDVLDVGQGDAILLRSPAGKTVLIDAGTGKRDVVPMLRARGLDKLDLAIATHAHADHIGGMDEVLAAVPPRVYVDQGMAHTTATYSKVMDLVESSGAGYKPGARGVVFNLDDGIRLELLGPMEPRLRGTRSDLNSNSVVVRVTKGERCMLFTGDAEEPTEQMLIQKGLEPCDVLKVAHHGSGHSSTQRFLDAVQPEVAIISCGRDNKYKHPYPETLERLARVGAKVYRTDLQGTVRVTTDGKSLDVTALGPEQGDGGNASAALAVPRPAFDESAPVADAGTRLDLNSATARQLDALPGIGPSKAAAIIRWRESHGPFTSIEQLDDVPGIGPATLAGLRGRVSLSPEGGSR